MSLYVEIRLMYKKPGKILNIHITNISFDFKHLKSQKKALRVSNHNIELMGEGLRGGLLPYDYILQVIMCNYILPCSDSPPAFLHVIRFFEVLTCSIHQWLILSNMIGPFVGLFLLFFSEQTNCPCTSQISDHFMAGLRFLTWPQNMFRKWKKENTLKVNIAP